MRRSSLLKLLAGALLFGTPLAPAYTHQPIQQAQKMDTGFIEISDDMLRCLDALRWARADLYTLVPDGDARVRSVIDRWGLQWPDDG